MFFSYSRDDSELVLNLAKELRQAGADVWLDQLDIPAGQRWDSAIQNALTDADTLIVALSKTSISSDNVMDEVSYALEKDKKVIPVLLEECEIPFRIRRLQFVDLTTNYEEGIKTILSGINAESPSVPEARQKGSDAGNKRPELPGATEQEKPKNKSKAVLVGVIMLVIVGLGYAYFNFSMTSEEEPGIISDTNQQPAQSHSEDSSNMTAAPLSYNVVAVDYKLGDKNPAGSFVQINESEWRETSNLNENVFYFEELGRDKNSIFIKDGRYNIELDLEYERIVLTSIAEPESAKIYYSIVGVEYTE